MSTGFTAAYLAECFYMVNDAYFYDNGDNRCKPWPYKGRDCSTFGDQAINKAAEVTQQAQFHVDPCLNSFGLASMCFEQARPEWFSVKFGAGLPGLFISHEAALVTVCAGFEGLDWGRRELPGRRGHYETSLGNGGGSIGAHSHATGVGVSRLDYHNLSAWAVLPGMLADMMPPPIDWAYLAELDEWLKRLTIKPLRAGDKGSDVETLTTLLVLKRWMPKPPHPKKYTPEVTAGVGHLKLATGIHPANGEWFGVVAGKRLLQVKG